MKDYSRSTGMRRGARGGTLLGVFIGLGLGLLIAVAIAFYLSKIPVSFSEGEAKEKLAQKDKQLADSAKPAVDARSEKPRFDFYRILPGQEVPVTEKEIKQQATKPNAPKEDYVIQAGAFQSPADADNLKARLALLGLEAAVEPAHLPEKGTVYRVRLGPYSELADINRVRQQLAQNGVDAALVKLKN